MSKATSLLRQIERRIAARRRPGAVMVMYWHDEEVTDEATGRRMSLDEWERLHPEATVIQLSWGDDAGDVALSHPIPADVWNNL